MSTSTVSVTPTMAVLIQEAMAKMPDTLNTKKEIDEYFKNAMKEIVIKKKEEEKVKKATTKVVKKPAAKRGEKKEKEKEVDDEGNEIEKVKKPVSNYMKFTEGHRTKVKAVITGLSPQNLFKEVAKLWKIYKEFVIEHKDEYSEEGDEKLTELWELRLEELLEKRNEELKEEEEEKKSEEEDKSEEEKEEEKEVVVAEKKKRTKKEKEVKSDDKRRK
jgi:hypothetical protein